MTVPYGMVALRGAHVAGDANPSENRMRYAIPLCLALAGCSTAGGSLVPLRAVGKVSGDSEGPQVLLANVPMNALVRAHGNFSYTVQPFAPFLTFDGDWTIVVEPMPGKEAEAQEAVRSGALLIRKRGTPSALNAPGSIQAFKALRVAMYAPPPPPPPAPLQTITDLSDAAFCDPNDPTCQLPK